MKVSGDYRDLFSILNEFRVKYLVVGAYAVAFYTEPRFTKDLDVWVEATAKNAERLYKALAKFGAPLRNLAPEDFKNGHMVYQIGVVPIRIDIMMGVPGLKFTDAWKGRKKTKYGGVSINILGIRDLITSKRKANRSQDLLDIDKLTRKP